MERCREEPSTAVQFRTAEELLKLVLSEETTPTGISEMDTLFGDGIPMATFVEFVGSSSTGKTQMWSVNAFIFLLSFQCIFLLSGVLGLFFQNFLHCNRGLT